MTSISSVKARCNICENVARWQELEDWFLTCKTDVIATSPLQNALWPFDTTVP